MAILNVSVELDWLGDDGNFDKAFKDAITSAIVSKINKSVIDNIKEDVETQITMTIGEKLTQYMDEMLNKPRNITDRWGEIVKENVSIKDQLMEELDKFITEKVDDNGHPSNYGGGKTRLQYLAEKIYKDECTSRIEKTAREVSTMIKELANKSLSEKIGYKLAETIGLKEELGL